jgi:hypothetical protein
MLERERSEPSINSTIEQPPSYPSSTVNRASSKFPLLSICFLITCLIGYLLLLILLVIFIFVLD